MKKNFFCPFLLFLLAQSMVGAKTIDFAVKNFQLSTKSDGMGAIVYTSLTTIPTGDSITLGHKLKFYFSKDTLVDASDILISSATADLPDYITSPHLSNSSFVIPENVPVGSYFVLAMIDLSGGDSNDKNNVTFQPFTVKPSNFDLRISECFLHEGQITPGSYQKMDIRISNVGTTGSGYNKKNIYLSSDQKLSSTDINIEGENNYSYFDGYPHIAYLDPIIPGETIINKTNFKIPATINSGNWYVIIRITSNSGTEFNPVDNQIAIPISIIPSEADITVNNLSIQSKRAAQGGLLKYSCQFKNLGKTVAQNVTGEFLLVNAKDKSSRPLPSFFSYYLKPDSSQTIAFNFEVPKDLASGSYTLKVIARNSLHELATNNNIMEVPIDIVEQDVRLLLDQKLDAYQFASGSLINVTTNLTNKGTTDIASGVIRHFISNDTILDIADIEVQSYPYPYTYYSEQLIKNLAANISVDYNYVLKFDVPEGKYFLLTSLRLSNQYYKKGKLISTSPQFIIVGPKKVDYSIEAIKPSSLHFNSGTTYNLSFKLKNEGNSHAFGVPTIFISSDSIYDKEDILLYGNYYERNMIQPGDSNIVKDAPYSIPNLPSGTYYLLYKCIVEDDSNLSNNIDILKIDVNRSDVKLVASDLQATFGKDRNSIAFNYIIKNTGTTESGYKRLYYYISPDTIYSQDDRPVYVFASISSGSSSHLSYEENIEFWKGYGDFYLLIVEDRTFNPSINFSYKPLARVKIQDFAIAAVEQNDLEGNNLQISLYPNPADNSFSILSLDNSEIISGEIKNQLGETVQNFTSLENINIDHLAPGLYLVYLYKASGIINKKLMIK